MEYFPFYMKTSGQAVLVVGGGEKALQKIRLLKTYGMEVYVVAKEVDATVKDYIEQNKEWIRLRIGSYRDKDLDGADYVIVATDDKGLNHWVAKSCKERRIPVNVVRDRKESSFVMPAIIQEGGIQIAISSGGKSPVATKYMKKKMKGQIPEGFGELVTMLGEYRDYVKERLWDEEICTEAFECLLSIGMANDCQLNEEIIKDVVQHLYKERE